MAAKGGERTFSDMGETSITSPAQSTYIDREWADTLENLLYEDSPMHSPMESTTLKDDSNGSIDYSTVTSISVSCSVSQTNSLQQEAYASTEHRQDNVHTGSSSRQLISSNVQLQCLKVKKKWHHI